MKYFSFVLFITSQNLFAQTQPRIKFEYQELAGDYQRYQCEHKHESFYDWLVWCQKGTSLKKYRVHLAVRRYAKTVFGSSGYEIMYWITDYTDSRRGIQNDSVTIWVHNSEDGNSMRALELRQGIENDLSQLNLYLSWSSR